MITKDVATAAATSVAPASPPQPGRWKVRQEFHSLLRSLPWPAANPADRQLATIGFTSCLPREGVTTFAMQTALAAASSGAHQILVVDANLIRPGVSKAAGISNEQGFANVLAGTCNPADAIQETKYDNLSVLTSGKLNCDPAALFGLPYRLHNLIEVLTDGFDLVIFDLPSIAKSNIAMPLLSPLDGVLMIVEHEKVPWQQAREVQEKLERAHVHLLGAVVNKKRTHLPRIFSKLVFSS